MADDKPTTIRPSAEILQRIEYLKKALDLTSFSAVIWHCVNRVYREEVKRAEPQIETKQRRK